MFITHFLPQPNQLIFHYTFQSFNIPQYILLTTDPWEMWRLLFSGMSDFILWHSEVPASFIIHPIEFIFFYYKTSWIQCFIYFCTIGSILWHYSYSLQAEVQYFITFHQIFLQGTNVISKACINIKSEITPQPYKLYITLLNPTRSSWIECNFHPIQELQQTI
jgi:hypothetical protein